MRPARIGVLFLFFVAVSSPLAAQITNVTNSTSTPTPGSGHDYIKMLNETVNPANGSVSIRVDTPVAPGRGLTLPFNFAYDSNGAHILKARITGGSASFGSNTTFLSQNGWSYGVPLLGANYVSKTVTLPNGRLIQCEIDKDFVFQDPSGDRHPLYLASTQTHSVSQCVDGPFLSGGDDFVIANKPDCYGTGSNCPVKVADADGTVFSFDGAFDVLTGFTQSGASLPTSVEDRNGNQIAISRNGAAFTFADTAGRPIVSSSGFGTNGNTVTISGITYTVSWGTATSNFGVNAQQVVANSECSGITSSSGSAPVITAISLPNGQAYQFSYDPTSPYGLLTQVTYPGGGWIKYAWALNPQSEVTAFTDALGHANSCEYKYDWPALSHRYVSFDGTNVALQQDFSYNPSTVWVPGGNTWTSKHTIVTTHDCARNNFNCAGAPSFTTTYSYTPVTVKNQPYDFDAFSTQIPIENTVTYGDLNGATLKTSTKTWNDAFQMACESITLATGQVSRTDYSYGRGLILTDKKEWDWNQAPVCGSAPSGSPLRETAIAYQTFLSTPIYPAPSISDRPSSVITYNNGTRVAEIDYIYDGGTAGSPCQGCALAGHDETNYGPSSAAARGNPTTVTAQCFPNCTSAVTKYTYDETGQLATKIDPCGIATCADMATGSHTTVYSYADVYSSCGGAAPPGAQTNTYLTTVTNSLGQNQSFCYGYNDGQLRGSTDANNHTTGYKYGTQPSGCGFPDKLDRLSEEDHPDGGNTTFCYDDASYNPSTSPPSPSVTTTRIATPSPTESTTVAFDGVGHTVRQVIADNEDCSGGDRTDTTYDGLGRGYTVSNPYCTTGDSTYGLSTYAYDALGRITQVKHPDSTTVLTNYTGRATQVQDEGYDSSGHRITRISQVDGLGRMSSLCEVSSTTLVGQNPAPANCALDLAGTGFLTTYLYDGLSNLKQVNQGTMTARTFVYDSLSRLTSSVNPESNTATTPTVTIVPTTYSYDANGNVSTKTGPKQNQTGTATVVSTYTYDVLNRNTQISYSDGTTPTAKFVYDVATAPSYGIAVSNPIGRLVEAIGGASGTAFTISSYDVMGRIANQYQQPPMTCTNCLTYYRFGYYYDLAGNMTSAGNGFFGTYTYGINTAGRLGSFSSSVVDQFDPGSLMSAAKYNAFGGLVSDTLGDTETQTFTYDKRLRLQSSSSVYSGTSLYSYSLGFTPNSNVQSANDSVNGNWTYTYDQLNRLVGSNQNSGAQIYSYVYDRFGNRWQQNGPITFSATFTGNNPANPANNNRIDTASGYTYDAAGNVHIAGLYTYTYDAENRLTAVTGSGTNATYAYDALGRRVARTGDTSLNVCGHDGIFYYLYNLEDRWTAALNSGGGQCDYELVYAGNRHIATYAGGTVFPHADWLGTERVRVNYTYVANRGNDEHCTSLPFGDALNCGGGGDPSPLHFTGKERDPESGLDNFLARYYTSSPGRFMSPDPLSSAALPIDANDPQSWNAYAYVRNNPLNLTDPDGAIFCRPANQPEQDSGVSQVCDVTDAQYVNSSKKQQAAYDEAGYKHFDCNCDSGADKDAWQHQNGNISNDWIGDALVVGAVYIGLEGLFRPATRGPRTQTSSSPQIRDAEEPGRLVIGKMSRDGTLRDGTLQPGERTLELPNQGSPRANWVQNSSKLREAVSEGKPIRDASAGIPGSNTGFLRAERNLLQDHGWTLQGDTWYPPNR